MRGPHTGRMPAAMQKRYDALAKALAGLPPHQPAPVTHPIFAHGPCPVAPPTPADLPPALAAAFSSLQAALDGPPCLGDQWPFANPPAVQAAIDAEQKSRAGRPSTVQPNQVVRLVRFRNLGYSIAESAAKATLKKSTAIDILKGRSAIAHHPAVEAAGVYLPNPKATINGRKSVEKAGKAPGSAEQARAATPVAKTASGAQNRGGL